MKPIGPGETIVSTSTVYYPKNDPVQTEQFNSGRNSFVSKVVKISNRVMSCVKKKTNLFKSGSSVQLGPSFYATSNSQSKGSTLSEPTLFEAKKMPKHYKNDEDRDDDISAIDAMAAKSEGSSANKVMVFKANKVMPFKNKTLYFQLNCDARILREEPKTKVGVYSISVERSAIEEQLRLRKARVEHAEAERASLVETSRGSLQKLVDSWADLSAKIDAKIESYNQQKNCAPAELGFTIENLLKQIAANSNIISRSIRGLSNFLNEFSALVAFLNSFKSTEIVMSQLDLSSELNKGEKISDHLQAKVGKEESEERKRQFDILKNKAKVTNEKDEVDNKKFIDFSVGHISRKIEEAKATFDILSQYIDEDLNRTESIVDVEEMEIFDVEETEGSSDEEAEGFSDFERLWMRSADWAAIPDDIKVEFLDFNSRMLAYEKLQYGSSFELVGAAYDEMTTLIESCVENSTQLLGGGEEHAKIIARINALRKDYLAPLIEEFGDLSSKQSETQ